MRGNWGAATGVAPNSHGNFKGLLKVIRIMEAIRLGQPVNAAALRTVQKGNPEYFEGNALAPKGKEVLERVMKLLPCAVSKDGIEYLRRRK